MLSRPAQPIRTLHLDALVPLVTRCLSGFTHFVILPTVYRYTMWCVPCYMLSQPDTVVIDVRNAYETAIGRVGLSPKPSALNPKP